jgi:SAM-dependent methyltransferase
MQQNDWYENWFGSPYYKILYQNRDENEAQAFIENLISSLQPSTACRMLDIACGEGRHAIQLAEHGYDVTAIDLSQKNIETAKAFENDNLHFYVHDMRFPFYINYFDFAFNFFTSFGYFAHDRDHILAAKSFSGCLKKNGILVIDYLNLDYVLKNMATHETVQRGSYTFEIDKSLVRNHITKDIKFTDANNKPRHYTETVAAFRLEDFTEMFTKAGLSLINTYGDYRLNKYHAADSPRMIMIFKK